MIQLDEYAVLDLLTRLVDQSLVTTDRVEGGTTRYAMLETVRQYAQERLNESREGEAARTRPPRVLRGARRGSGARDIRS